MKISHHDNGRFNLSCTREELAILSNALNNIPQAVSESDYSSLIGASKAEVEKVLDLLCAALSAD
ncbi:MAG: hypothetical protein ABL909_04480 [Sphingopyxis sp.]